MGFYKLSISPNLIKDRDSRISYSGGLINYGTKGIFIHTAHKPIHKLILMIKQIIAKVTSNYTIATVWNFRQAITEVQKENIISICFWIWGSVNCSTDNRISTKYSLYKIDSKNFSSIIVNSSQTENDIMFLTYIPTPTP